MQEAPTSRSFVRMFTVHTYTLTDAHPRGCRRQQELVSRCTRQTRRKPRSVTIAARCAAACDRASVKAIATTCEHIDTQSCVQHCIYMHQYELIDVPVRIYTYADSHRNSESCMCIRMHTFTIRHIYACKIANIVLMLRNVVYATAGLKSGSM